MSSGQKQIQNPVKHLKWSTKRSILNVWQGSEYASSAFLKI